MTGSDDCGSTAAGTNHARSTQRSDRKYNLVSQKSLSDYDIQHENNFQYESNIMGFKYHYNLQTNYYNLHTNYYNLHTNY